MANVATGVAFGVATGVVNDASESPESSVKSGLAQKGRSYMSAAFRKVESGRAIDIDIDRVCILDRACLRLLVRCGVGTCIQLARLVYGQLHETQRRLLRLYRAGLLERTTVAHTPLRKGEYAYRVSETGHQRLVTRLTPAPPSYVRHMLDAVDAVISLNRSDDREHPQSSSGCQTE